MRLGVVPVAVRPLTGPLHDRVSRQLPRVRLQLIEGFSAPLEEQVRAGQIDLAVINRLGQVRRRGEQRLCTLDTHVLGPPGAFGADETLTFRQLADHPLVLAARPAGSAQRWISSLERQASRCGSWPNRTRY